MNSADLKRIAGISILVILVCAGIFIYVEWEIKRFDASLPEVPSVDTAPNAAALSESPHQEVPQPPAASVSDSPLLTAAPEGRETDSARSAETFSVVEEPPSEFTGNALDLFLEETETVPVEPEEEFTQGQPEEPYDIAKVEAGFADYNAYLATNPAYAYQRLDAAWREQWGDSPDVDILVETVIRGNAGTATIDDAIASTEALLRLMPGIVVPEGIQVVADHLAYLKESKQLALEEGAIVQFSYTPRIGE